MNLLSVENILLSLTTDRFVYLFSIFHAHLCIQTSILLMTLTLENGVGGGWGMRGGGRYDPCLFVMFCTISKSFASNSEQIRWTKQILKLEKIFYLLTESRQFCPTQVFILSLFSVNHPYFRFSFPLLFRHLWFFFSFFLPPFYSLSPTPSLSFSRLPSLYPPPPFPMSPTAPAHPLSTPPSPPPPPPPTTLPTFSSSSSCPWVRTKSRRVSSNQLKADTHRGKHWDLGVQLTDIEILCKGNFLIF